MNSQNVKIVMGDPVIIAQAPQDLNEWGYYQFPGIEMLADGRTHVHYHIQPDHVFAYGMERGHAVSNDRLHWEALDSEPENGGILLSNGDRIRIKHLRSIIPEQVNLPSEPVEITKKSYGEGRKVFLYDAAGFPPEISGWPIERLTKGEAHWKLEIKQINIPGELRCVVDGFISRQMFWRMRLAPNGDVWAISYFYKKDGCNPIKVVPLFFVSKDGAHTFTYHGSISYNPPPKFDTLWEKRDGFTEPDVTFAPDGSVFCLLRTTNGYGVGPLCSCRSVDGGKNWTRPQFFDDLGVWPELLTLSNGITLAAYGRPGLYIRATADPSCETWDDRIPIIKHPDTCAYSAMVAVGENRAFIAYSDFKIPDETGVPVKTILGREITAEIINNT